MTPDEIVGGLRARARYVRSQLAEADVERTMPYPARLKRIQDAVALDEAAADLIEELLKVRASCG